MSARSGSLGWVVIAGAITIAVSGAMWGLLDSQFVDSMIATDVWAASTEPIVSQGREYVIATWDWLLLVIALRVGLEAMVASRLRGAATSLPKETMVIFSAHLILIVLVLVFSEMTQPMYAIATDTTNATGQAVASAGYDEGVKIGYEWGIGVLPAVLLLVTDVWYLSAPIRRDMLRR